MSIESEVRKIAENKISDVAETLQHDLQLYARQHRRTGQLARNITLEKTKNFNYKISGGTRSSYSDNTYHALTFFKTDEGQTALTRALKHARNQLKR